MPQVSYLSGEGAGDVCHRATTCHWLRAASRGMNAQAFWLLAERAGAEPRCVQCSEPSSWAVPQRPRDAGQHASLRPRLRWEGSVLCLSSGAHTATSSSELDGSGFHRGQFKPSREELLIHTWPWLLCKRSLPVIQRPTIREFASELVDKPLETRFTRHAAFQGRGPGFECRLC